MHLPCINIHTSQHFQEPLFPDHSPVSLAPVQGKKVLLDFERGNTTSDAGVILLSETESMIRIISTLARCITDARRSSSVMHSMHDLLSQRVYQIGCGYEDGVRREVV
jgi:Transposase DDE domain group 1